MPHIHPFQESFWSPTASIDPLPDFRTGYNVLHNKLTHSAAENKAILHYIRQRIAIEQNHAHALANMEHSTSAFDHDLGGSLKKCFEVVCAESTESAREHYNRAMNLHTTALDPLVQFFARYDRILAQAKLTVESQLNGFDVACKAMDAAQTFYRNRCKTLMFVKPEYKEVEVGKQWRFPTRDHAWIQFQETYEAGEALEEEVLQSWEQLGFLKKVNGEYVKQSQPPATTLAEEEEENSPNKGFSGFLGRWGGGAGGVKKDDILMDMLEADKEYRLAVHKAETMRTVTEQVLFVHYEEMESLELERIQTIKQAFVSLAASLSNTIPRCKETFDNMMLYQETLKPDKDVQFVVEQYRTGRYCPEPILYVNYFHGTAIDQLFGVSLEAVTRVQGSFVPQIITEGLSVVESGFSRLYDEEKNVVWTASQPLDRVHAAREEINSISSKTSTRKTLEKFDLLLVASLLRLYLLELPECLFTFELYEPCKLLYSNQSQDKDSRLASISKLLATLPTANYHTVMTLLGHFHKLVKQLQGNTEFTSSLAKSFSYVLMRPQVESKISIHERHPQRLLQDLIDNFDSIFTQESHHAQEKNSTRPSIVIPPARKSNSMDEEGANSRQRSSSSSSNGKKSTLLSAFMRTSHSTPTNTTTTHAKPKPALIPMPSYSTLFEDPDEISRSSESSTVVEPHQKSVLLDDSYMMEELASLDSFFQDEED